MRQQCTLCLKAIRKTVISTSSRLLQLRIRNEGKSWRLNMPIVFAVSWKTRWWCRYQRLLQIYTTRWYHSNWSRSWTLMDWDWRKKTNIQKIFFVSLQPNFTDQLKLERLGENGEGYCHSNNKLVWQLYFNWRSKHRSLMIQHPEIHTKNFWILWNAAHDSLDSTNKINYCYHV